MKTLGALKTYLRGSYHLAIASLFFAIVSVGCKIAIPFVVGLAIDVLKSGDFNIAFHIFLCIGLLCVGALFRYCFDIAISHLGQRTVKKMRDTLLDSIQKLPLSYIDSHPKGDILLRLINDVENVQTGLIMGAAALYEGIIQIIMTVAFMFLLNWVLAITVIVLTPISVIVSRFISTHNAKYFKAQNAEMGNLTACSLEAISSMEAIRSYGEEARRIAELDEDNESVRKATFKAYFAASWINPMTRVVNNAIYSAVILIGALMIVYDVNWGFAFTVGGLSSFLSYSHQYMTPFNEIADASTEVMSALASFKRIEEIIHGDKDVDEGQTHIEGEIDSLCATNIDFSYDGKRMIIQGFNLDIYKGHKIAFVGPTGCGKTTIINLLMRFYDPQEGGFLVNGVSTLEIAKAELRSHIGMVLQDTWLKTGTIAENIAYGNPDASEEEIIEAAKKAHADEFIRRFKDGYQTVISNSSGLSTGEKQLLCVARIMLAHPEIVLLDEATSNIDLRTEHALAGAFDELMRGKTSLVVAHRLSTIQNADHIVVLKEGRIIEQGNFKELMAMNGFFAELYHSQLA